MASYNKVLHTIKPKDLKKRIISGSTATEYDIYLAIVGIFETKKAHWVHYLVSAFTLNNKMYITNDVCDISYTEYNDATINNIQAYGRKIQSIEEGLKWAEDFKVKWETGSNDTIAEKRDQKLNEILS